MSRHAQQWERILSSEGMPAELRMLPDEWRAMVIISGRGTGKSRRHNERSQQAKTRASIHIDLFRAASDYLWRADWTRRPRERRIWDAFCEGLTCGETATREKMPRETVKSIVRRLRVAAGIPYERSKGR